MPAVLGAASRAVSVSFVPPASGSAAVGSVMQICNRHYSASPEQLTAPGTLAIGDMVRVHSLQSAYEHNGKLGEIVKHDLGKDQWGVKTVTGIVISRLLR